MTAHRFRTALRRARLLTWALAGATLGLATPARAQQVRTVRLSLADALQMAERNSEAVAVARAGVTRAVGQHLQTRSQSMPQLSGNGGYTKTLKSQFSGLTAPAPDTSAPASVCAPRIAAGATPAERAAAIAQASTCQSSAGFDLSSAGFGAKNQWTVGVNASLNVYTGGRIAGQTQAAVAQEKSANIEVEAQRAQLKLDVAQSYFDANLTDRLLSLALASLQQTEQLFTETTLGRKVGDVSDFDVLRAQVTRDNQRPAVIQARSNRDIAYFRLKQLLELPLDDSVALTTVLDETNIGLPLIAVTLTSGVASDTMTADRAPVRELEQSLIAQEGLLKAARAERIPTLSVVSGYQRLYFPNTFFPNFSQPRDNWTIGLSTNFSLFTGGRIQGDVLVAQAGLDETRERLKQTRELASLDTRVALSQFEQAQAAWQASAGTADQAQRALSIDEIRFREGISTQTDLAQSRLLVEQAVANRAQAARDLAVAKIRVQLLGDLPLQANSSASAARPQQTQQQTNPQPSGTTGPPGGQPDGAR
jgi:outer membrane protein TolC